VARVSNGTPAESREGVRAGILASIREDTERRAGRTARLLASAGVAGVVAGLGVTLLVSGHPFGHHASWHVVAFSAVWAGLLVVAFALVFLGVRTPTLPLTRAVSVGLLGLGLAGLCGAACPDPHFLDWWLRTAAGARLAEAAGVEASAVCFGLATALSAGAVSAFLLLSAPIRPLLPAAALLVLLAPGVALQTVGSSAALLAGWLAGTAAGAYLGVASGMRARALLAPGRVA
jgi:hypothetical protein